jgi:hypothetical protein
MKPIHFKEITDYQPIVINGVPCLFTDCCIDKNSLPENLYAYDLRDSDNGEGFSSIEPFVLVNHGGTILTEREIPMTEDGSTPVKEYDFTDNEGSAKLLALIEA